MNHGGQARFSDVPSAARLTPGSIRRINARAPAVFESLVRPGPNRSTPPTLPPIERAALDPCGRRRAWLGAPTPRSLWSYASVRSGTGSYAIDSSRARRGVRPRGERGGIIKKATPLPGAVKRERPER
jgi:hypothetical protein